MCNAFSCIVTQKKKAIWKFGTDSHDTLLRGAGIPDNSKDPKTITFCRIEISPDGLKYLDPDAKYRFKIDMDITPVWWTDDHEKVAWKAFQNWKKELDKIIVQKPIVHPFHITPPKEITEDHIRLLKQWDSVGASVRASVRASVWASVGDSVGDSVRASVGDSVRASVGDSVGDSVGAYTGTFFILPRESWKYTEDIKTNEYPFQCLADLWEQGLVPSFDGKKWRLHGGKDARILWEGEI